MDSELEESPNPIKSLFEYEYGTKGWIEIKMAHDIETWRKYSIRIIQDVGRNVTHRMRQNAKPADLMFEDVVSQGEDAIKRADTIEDIFASLAGTMGSLCIISCKTQYL